MSDSLVKSVSDALRSRGLKLATAESCTGGMIAAAVTDLAGSSDIFDRGFVTYSNEAKIAMLGVSLLTIEAHGAVSAETAAEMAEGALKHSLADMTVAVTGIAGPSGGSDEKPVGLVYIATAGKAFPTVVTRNVFPGDRDAVRRRTVETALSAVREALAR